RRRRRCRRPRRPVPASAATRRSARSRTGTGRRDADGRAGRFVRTRRFPRSARILVNRRQAVNAALVLFGLVLFGWRLGGAHLWPREEPRFGLVAREMLERGDPIVLSRNGRLYTDKPPLFFWAIDAAALLLRGGQVDEAAARLPSLLGSVLALL